VNDWRQPHRAIMEEFLAYLNDRTENFVLKGGTALLLCYQLDRFSEDIDLDGEEKSLLQFVQGFCTASGFSYRTAKDSPIVQRCLLNYGDAEKPLRIEASYRRREIPAEETMKINGIRVYGVDALCVMKSIAYAGRDKIRDLYDLVFICNRYFEQLSPQTVSLLRNSLEYKGIEQFDYIMREQKDELIDGEALAANFLEMYDRIGLLTAKDAEPNNEEGFEP
jgi:predicted nucleotidyltransferase component of viral defense system